jgi:hypothetical protein
VLGASGLGSGGDFFRPFLEFDDVVVDLPGEIGLFTAGAAVDFGFYLGGRINESIFCWIVG